MKVGANRLDTLLAWLDQFASEPGRILCFDYGGDGELLMDLVGELPPGWQAQQINAQLDPERSEAYYRDHGGRHHAPFDARANRYALGCQ